MNRQSAIRFLSMRMMRVGAVLALAGGTFLATSVAHVPQAQAKNGRNAAVMGFAAGVVLGAVLGRAHQGPYGGGYETYGYPQGGYPQGGYPPATYPQGNYPQSVYPNSGYPGGYPQGGIYGQPTYDPNAAIDEGTFGAAPGMMPAMYRSRVLSARQASDCRRRIVLANQGARIAVPRVCRSVR